jgi:uncharacterized protein YdhG (YjbR/CyaY superfamily)
VNEYLAAQPPDVRKALRRVRTVIRRALPRAEEAISYQIPAYKLDGRTVIYFAGFKEHYSLYPFTRRLETAFEAQIAPFEISGKGTIRFPVSEPVPVALIAAIARFRANEAAESAKTKAATRKR